MLFLFARMLLLPVTVTTRIIPFLSFGDPFTRLYIQPLFGRGSIFTILNLCHLGEGQNRRRRLARPRRRLQKKTRKRRHVTLTKKESRARNLQMMLIRSMNYYSSFANVYIHTIIYIYIYMYTDIIFMNVYKWTSIDWFVGTLPAFGLFLVGTVCKQPLRQKMTSMKRDPFQIEGSKPGRFHQRMVSTHISQGRQLDRGKGMSGCLRELGGFWVDVLP